jgi:hypothetical protein
MIPLRGTILRIASFSRLLLVFALFSLLFMPSRAGAAVPPGEAAKMLPDRAGDFRAQGAAVEAQDNSPEYLVRGDGVLSAASREYVSPKGMRLHVLLVKTNSDAAAYALLTSLKEFDDKQPNPLKAGDVGTVSIDDGNVSFFKGSTFVRVDAPGPPGTFEAGDALARSLARSLAEPLDKGEGDIPVLIKHLPGWETARENAAYAVGLGGLQRAVIYQPVLEAVSFEGGTEAVRAFYDAGEMVVVEYTTPQIATDSDARITERIKQLKEAGQPVPSAYRRVGNYSVFVFHAPDERAAAQLMDQINYEQVVQWLGTNPYILQRAQREYVNTMGGTILAVVKASGLSLIVCFGIGGLVGALVFKRRRAQAAAVDAYSDAGGMLRLNIDEMTRQTDPGRLLGRGEG